jgi:hypothetical protein
MRETFRGDEFTAKLVTGKMLAFDKDRFESRFGKAYREGRAGRAGTGDYNFRFAIFDLRSLLVRSL